MRFTHLIIIFLTLLPNNIEKLKAILALARAHHPQPIAQLLLLEELLSQVLQVPPAELLMRDDFDPAIAEVGDVDSVAEIARAAVDFDTLLQEGREGGGVEDSVLGWLGCIDGELSISHVSGAVQFGSVMTLMEDWMYTFFVIFWPFLGAPFKPPPPAVGLFYVLFSTCSQAYCSMPKTSQSRRRRAA